MTEQAMVITDNGEAQGFYRQEIVNTAQQITDAGTLKRIYLLARRLLGKQVAPEQPTKKPTQRMIDTESVMRHTVGLNDANVRRVAVVARTLAQMEQEAGQKPTEPESWCEKACALLPQLSAEDQEVIYWRIGTMLARPSKTTAKTPQAEALEDLRFTLKALVNHEMADVIKPKTLDAILSYVRVVKRREGRE